MLPTAKALHYPAHPHQSAPPWQTNISVPVSIRWRNRSMEIKLLLHGLRPL